MNRTTFDLQWPAAPRATERAGISLADVWCWAVAQRTYELAAARYSSPGKPIRWEKLTPATQDIWFWRARYVMAALDKLEGNS